MEYKKLAEFYNGAGSTTKRLEKIAILAKFLKHLDEKDRDVLYLKKPLSENGKKSVIWGKLQKS